MHKRLIAGALLAVVGAAHAAPIELYEQPQLRGAMLGLDAATARLSDYNFNDRPRSLVVRSGQWEICADAEFRGQCQVFGPGEYRELPPGFMARISSVRPAAGGGWSGAPGVVVAGTAGGRGQGSVTLYRDVQFGGTAIDISGATPDLGSLRFNDEASSIEVRYGQWQFCRDANYGGQCQVLGPGRYNLPPEWNDELSSLRPADGQTGAAAGGSATLFRDINGGGQSLYVSGPTPNLQQQGFNDTASSVEIQGGSWQLCVDADYKGYCLTLAAGRHNLSGLLQDGLSSLRPVGQAMNWRQGGFRD